MSNLGLSKPVHVSFSIPSYLVPLGALSLCLIGAYRLKWRDGSPEPLDHVVASPLGILLPKLSDLEKCRLPYPPDLFPGARDVQTPYGSLRVYEWGPESGRKVLLVHGISTPCLSLGLLAQHLVDNGCRVILFDLFGRGYSDDPGDLKHDARLYTTQILLAIASSPLAWTGTNGFSIIGYSLGGGISASFADTFPNLIDSLILLAPSGIVRLSHIAWSSKFMYQAEGILPEPLITDATSATAAELGDETAVFPDRPQVDATAAVQWQLQNHRGFVPAFISAVRNAPITNQHASWKRIGKRLSAQKASSSDPQAVGDGMSTGKALLLLGKTDPIIKPSEVGADAAECFGEDNLEMVIIDGGHEIPVSHAKDVADAILKYWGKK